MAKPKGINTARKKRADGSIEELHYHRATNVRIHGDPTTPEFAAYVERLDREAEELKKGRVEKPRDLIWLIRAYQAAPDWTDLAKSTRTIEQYNIKALEAEFGVMTLKAIEERGARTMFLEWHDELAEEQPRGADAKLARLARIFAFGVDREHLNVNPIASFKRAYKGDRSEIIWLPEHVRQFTATAKGSLCDALALAFHTGQRRGDLLAVRWSAFDGKALSLTQSKTGARVYIPCTRALLQTLARLKDDYEARIEAAEMRGEGETVADTILTNNASSWTPDAFKQAWRYAYLSAWPAPAAPPDLHFHDLRGTAVTMLAEAGCTVPEIASITGHSMESAARILERYLGATKVMAENAIAKLEARNGPGGGGPKPAASCYLTE